MSDAENTNAEELEFELVTSARQLGQKPPLRKEAVTVPDWPTTSGKPARFLVWELTQNDWADCTEAGRVYKNGLFQRYDPKDEDIRLLSWALRDPHGNRLWHSVEVAKGELGSLGKASFNLLMNAVSRVNNAKDAEGNSDETPKAS